MDFMRSARATSKCLRKAAGLEVTAVQLRHKQMTTTDEHYNDRDMDDLKGGRADRKGVCGEFCPRFFCSPDQTDDGL